MCLKLNLENLITIFNLFINFKIILSRTLIFSKPKYDNLKIKKILCKYNLENLYF